MGKFGAEGFPVFKEVREVNVRGLVAVVVIIVGLSVNDGVGIGV